MQNALGLMFDMFRCLRLPGHSFEQARELMAVARMHGVLSVAESCPLCGKFHIRSR